MEQYEISDFEELIYVFLMDDGNYYGLSNYYGWYLWIYLCDVKIKWHKNFDISNMPETTFAVTVQIGDKFL